MNDKKKKQVEKQWHFYERGAIHDKRAHGLHAFTIQHSVTLRTQQTALSKRATEHLSCIAN